MTWHLITTEFPPMVGGISTWTLSVAQALHQSGEQVVVYARNGTEPPVQTDFPVRPIYGRSWGRWAPLWAWIAVRPRLKAGDRILCATWPLAVHLVGGTVPVGVAFHGSDLTRPAKIAGKEKVIQQATALLPVSHFLGSLLKAPYTVLPYPITPQAQARPGQKILTIARLTPLKGIASVLRLGAKLGRSVTVVGEGPERAKLENLAQTLGVDATFTGMLTPDKIPWDDTWFLALLSEVDQDGSGAEGLGLVLLEAAARGIPTIGSSVGGIPEACSLVYEEGHEHAFFKLPNSDQLRTWLYRHHGIDHCVMTLRSLLRDAEGGV